MTEVVYSINFALWQRDGKAGRSKILEEYIPCKSSRRETNISQYLSQERISIIDSERKSLSPQCCCDIHW